MAPQVPNGGRSTAHAEKVGNTMMHGGKKVQLVLESQAQNWTAPSATDASRGGVITAAMSGTSLAQQVNTILGRQCPTPMAADDGRKVTVASHQNSLIKACHEFCILLPPSSLGQAIAAGSMSSIDTPNSNQPSQRRRLNPIFVEALMRWPTGLSGFERQAMALTRWQLLMPSFLSTLCSRRDDAPADLFGDR